MKFSKVLLDPPKNYPTQLRKLGTFASQFLQYYSKQGLLLTFCIQPQGFLQLNNVAAISTRLYAPITVRSLHAISEAFAVVILYNLRCLVKFYNVCSRYAFNP